LRLLPRFENFHQSFVFFTAFRAERKMLLDAGNNFIHRLVGELAFGKFTDVLQTGLASIWWTGAEANHISLAGRGDLRKSSRSESNASLLALKLGLFDFFKGLSHCSNQSQITYDVPP
jgi:hypothetical protein